MLHARRIGNPQVFAYFSGYAKIHHVFARKQQVGADGYLFAVELDRTHIGRPRHKVACFVELVICRQVHLGNEAQYLAPAQYGSNVQQLPRHAKGHSYCDKGIHLA